MKKGITFMVVVIMIAIIMTLTTTVVISGISAFNNSKKIQFASEIAFVQELLNSLNYLDTDLSYGEVNIIDLKDASQDVKEQFSNEVLTDEKVTLYRIDPKMQALNDVDLAYGTGKDENDVFLYSLDTKKVYYKKGIELSGKLYYTLTDELKEKIDYELVENKKLENILFIPNTTEWTSSSVDCQVKISNKLYENITVKKSFKNEAGVTKEENVAIADSFSDYDVYNVSNDTNYSIIVNYTSKKDSVTLTKTYNVTNIDKIAPVLEISNIKTLNVADEKTTKKYVEIISKSDNESGIKCIKYENTAISEPEYFKTNGINLKLNINTIDFPDYAENITVYIEDNAGNYKMIKL